MEKQVPHLAVLIDAENAQLAILQSYSRKCEDWYASVRRVYGDFTNQGLSSWRDPMLAHSMQPIQQFRTR